MTLVILPFALPLLPPGRTTPEPLKVAWMCWRVGVLKMLPETLPFA